MQISSAWTVQGGVSGENGARGSLAHSPLPFSLREEQKKVENVSELQFVSQISNLSGSVQGRSQFILTESLASC